MSKRALVRIVVVALLLLVVGAWLYRYLDGIALDRREERLLAAIVADFEEIEADPLARPPVFGEPVPGPGADHYREAARLWEEFGDSLIELPEEVQDAVWEALGMEWWEVEGPRAEFPPEIRGRLDPVFAAVTRGARTEVLGRLVTHRDWLRREVEERNPMHLTFVLAHTVVKAGIGEARLRAKEGGAESALDLLICLDRLCVDLARDQSWLQRVSSGIQRRLLLDLAAELLSSGLLPADQVRRLAMWLRGSGGERPDRARADGVSLAWDQLILLTDGRAFLKAGSPESLEERVEGLFEDRLTRREFLDWIEDLREGCSRFVAVLEERGPEARADATLELTKGTGSDPLGVRSSLAVSLRFVEDEEVQREALRAALLAGVEFHVFRLREGRAPASVAEILPPDLPPLPEGATLLIVTDPATGEAELVFTSPYGAEPRELRMR